MVAVSPGAAGGMIIHIRPCLATQQKILYLEGSCKIETVDFNFEQMVVFEFGKNFGC